jgi:hypothetical protein
VISLTTEHDGDVVELIMDKEGLADLETILGWFRDGSNDYHLMSAEWGGDVIGLELDEPSPGRVLVHMFTLRHFA